MAFLQIGPDDAVYFEHVRPKNDDTPTFVFVNALTGSTAMWQASVAPSLRDKGFGTLVYDFRGQASSLYGTDARLDPEEITGDLGRLLAAEAPARPVLVGLSIGGLFAARAVLDGAAAAGLVLINMLRRPGLRLDWINEGFMRLVRAGGFPLLLDTVLPMLVGPDALADMCKDRLADTDYVPAASDDAGLRLMANGASADWDVAYEDLALPVLVMTGLQDRVFLVGEDVAALTDRIPDARAVEIADAGHLIPLERPAAVVTALAAFAAALP